MEIIDKCGDGDKSFVIYYDETDDGFVSAIQSGDSLYSKHLHGTDLNSALSDHHRRMELNGVRED